MDFGLYVLAGAVVGFAVGLTGVGGGSLMTPLLLLFGFPPQVAVGTDLLYASITKSTGIYMHAKRTTIRWRIVALMAAGSLPAALATTWLLASVFRHAEEYASILTTSLGIMLVITSVVLMFRGRIQQKSHENSSPVLISLQQHKAVWTIVMGVILGVLVTLSSVGAGAIGTAVLLILYPRLPSVHIVGTDLAHAVPLTLVAGIGHLFLGHVNWELLAALLVGSVPAIYVGTHAGAKMPDKILQPILVTVLMALGLKYAIF
ncbi:MAG: sulfite exporter TauE/SafE family protein [Gammaproteobacteria bacterium]|jgi:uncharacterized membrane protein YfcA|nr:sulfite exporter TauE/SafE family protein [Gammaproteobacteria bacterium]MBQ0773531.1 sulfite exporter TauE/SafE family protein [Gammaproteobacteria bacterium]|tara:strand:- start:215334 stop:216116 length:783 start_codon:yes stop_codon:yes gene_type:complete